MHPCIHASLLIITAGPLHPCIHACGRRFRDAAREASGAHLVVALETATMRGRSEQINHIAQIYGVKAKPGRGNERGGPCTFFALYSTIYSHPPGTGALISVDVRVHARLAWAHPPRVHARGCRYSSKFQVLGCAVL